MSEGRLLSLVARYPHPTALARRTRDNSMFMTLHRLEAGGFLSRSAGNYRLTRRGRDELAMTRAVSPAHCANGRSDAVTLAWASVSGMSPGELAQEVAGVVVAARIDLDGHPWWCVGEAVRLTAGIAIVHSDDADDRAFLAA